MKNKDKVVKDIQLLKNMTVNELVNQMYESGGFSAKKIGIGVKILKEMFEDRNCIKFLSFPACIIATGTRGIIKELIKQKLVDVVITTCGTLDHDLARVWENYYHGTFYADDKDLHKKEINRLGNIFIPNESYGIILEKKMKEILDDLWESGIKEFSTREIIWEFGKRINDENSIIYWCAKNKIPIYVPGITDGAFGNQLVWYSQEHDIKLDLFKDEKELSDIVFQAKKTGGLIIGGGISKHHVIWWNQFKGGLDYAVYITTAVEYDGSLSGAKLKEAISWGKLKDDAKYVTIEGEATVILPLMMGAIFND